MIMCALSSAVGPSAGGVPRRATAGRASACLTKMTCKRNSVVTAAAGEKSSQEPDAVRGLLKKAKLISRRGACNGGAPVVGKKEPFLAPSVKRRKISTLVEQKKFAEESKDDKLGEESKGEVVLEQESKGGDTGKIIGTSGEQSTAEAESVSGEDTGVPVYYIRPNKPVFVRPVIDMAGLIHKAKLRRQQLEMERAALRDQSIHPRVMRELGHVLVADA